MEIIWIVAGTLCIIVGIRYTINNGSGKIPIFASMALVSFVFARIRHQQRKKSKL